MTQHPSGQVSRRIAAIESQLDLIQTAVDGYQCDEPVEPPPVEPPDPVEPPPVDPPEPGSRPGEDLDWGVRRVPTEFHWIAEGNMLVHQSTRHAIDTSTGGFGDAYRYSRSHGDTGQIVFGVVGQQGIAAVGGRYGTTGPSDIAYEGEQRPSAAFVGLNETASIQLSFAFASSKALEPGDVCAFNIGLRGASDSFVIRCDGAKQLQDVVLDGCWYLASDPAQRYKSGIHLSNWQRFVLRNHKWRGEEPGMPGLDFNEHSGAYLKSGYISTLLENNDCRGGNRSFSQRRPQPFLDDGTPKNHVPEDYYMARGNYGVGIGNNWPLHQADGGAVLTLWVSDKPAYFYDNDFEDFRFTGIAIIPQPTYSWDPNKVDRNFDFLPSGNQHREVHVAGNRLIAGPSTQRKTFEATACDRLTIHGDNDFGTGPVMLNGQTSHRYDPNQKNIDVQIIAPERPSWNLQTYDPALGAKRALTDAEVNAMLRPA